MLRKLADPRPKPGKTGQPSWDYNGARERSFMTELARAAALARARLAAAMSALDAADSASMFDRVVIPLASASGALYRVETELGAGTEGDIAQARAAIRTVLATLQDTDLQLESIDRAMQNVAACLGLTHEMSELRQAAPAPMMPMAAGPAYHPSRPVSAAAKPEPKRPSPYPDFSLESTVHVPPAAGAHSTAPLSSTQNSPGVRKAPKPSAGATGPADLSTTQMSRSRPAAPADKDRTPTGEKARSPGQSGEAQAVRSAGARPAAGGSGTLQSAGQAPREGTPDPRWVPPNSRHAPGPAAGPEPGAFRVEANLGTHSPTNFYKGLRGNDVVDHGGLFVATYEAPSVGTPLWLRVTLPGGYSFDANAVVRWTRRQGNGDTPPGFGATFVSLSPEARQLVYRFTKNREPLFHDDI